MKRVFISGPMSSSGEPGPNLHQAAHAAARILEAGHAPFVPHLYWLLDAIRPVSASRWKESDQAWLRSSDIVLRLPGHSKGADEETELAQSLGIPIHRCVEPVVSIPERR